MIKKRKKSQVDALNETRNCVKKIVSIWRSNLNRDPNLVDFERAWGQALDEWIERPWDETMHNQ